MFRAAVVAAVFLITIAHGCLTADADVLDKSSAGFTVRHSVVVPVAANVAWAEFVDVAAWWGDDHTFSGSAANLKLDAAAGGCFCETLTGGGSVMHLRVVDAQPNEMLRLVGAMGPLQPLAVQGTLSVAFKTVERGTEVTLTYAVGGYLPGGLQDWAPRVDAMFAGQAQHFSRQFPK